MNTHPLELLPAYLLGALSNDEARQVAAHVQCCHCCQAEIEACRVALGLLPGGATPAAAPPSHIKQCLMQRITADLQRRAFVSPGVEVRRRS